MVQTFPRQQLAGVGKADLHRGLPLEHGHHQTDMPERYAVHTGNAQEDGRGLLCLRLRRRGRNGIGVQRIQGITHDLGRLFIPHRQPPFHQHRRIDSHIAAALLDGTAEAQQFDGRYLVLHHHIGHEGVVFGGSGPVGSDDTGHGDVLPVGIAGRPSLGSKVLQKIVDRYRTGGTGCGTVVVHGVAAEVQARSLLFHEHPLGGGVFRHFRQVDGSRLFPIPGGHAEHIQLPLHVDLAAAGNGVQHLFVDLHQLGTISPHGIESPGLDEILHSPLIHISAVEHPLAEILE